MIGYSYVIGMNVFVNPGFLYIFFLIIKMYIYKSKSIISDMQNKPLWAYIFDAYRNIYLSLVFRFY